MRLRPWTWIHGVLVSAAVTMVAACAGEDTADPLPMQAAGTFSLPGTGGSLATAGTFVAPGTPSASGSNGSAGRAPALPAGGAGRGAAGAPAAAGSGVAGSAGSLVAGTTGTAGAPVAGSAGPAAGAGAATGGMAGSAMAMAGSGGTGASMGSGECCDDGNCLCHGAVPSDLTSARGPFKTAEYRISTGTVSYPTDAEPPFAGVALCGGFLNTGPEMASWGPFYASYGIVTVITTTTGADLPDLRATKLLASIMELKAENTKSGSPLMGKLSDRFGTSGYSMGGGGTTIASGQSASLKTSVGLAPWGGIGNNVKVPTLLLCGSADSTAPCSMAQGVYQTIASPTPKMLVTISGSSHFAWFGPTDAGGGLSGKYALAFQKVFLEGDERWLPLLKKMSSGGAVMTNIQ